MGCLLVTYVDVPGPWWTLVGPLPPHGTTHSLPPPAAAAAGTVVLASGMAVLASTSASEGASYEPLIKLRIGCTQWDVYW